MKSVMNFKKVSDYIDFMKNKIFDGKENINNDCIRRFNYYIQESGFNVSSNEITSLFNISVVIKKICEKLINNDEIYNNMNIICKYYIPYRKDVNISFLLTYKNKALIVEDNKMAISLNKLKFNFDLLRDLLPKYYELNMYEVNIVKDNNGKLILDNEIKHLYDLIIDFFNEKIMCVYDLLCIL